MGCEELYVRSLEKENDFLAISEKNSVFNFQHIMTEMNPQANKRQVPFRNKIIFTLKQWNIKKNYNKSPCSVHVSPNKSVFYIKDIFNKNKQYIVSKVILMYYIM